VPGISCDHCRRAIESALAGVDGVTEAVVDVAAKTVTVAIDEGRVGLDEVEAAVAEAGYEVAARRPLDLD
jgi:copper chaperone CopZ